MERSDSISKAEGEVGISAGLLAAQQEVLEQIVTGAPLALVLKCIVQMLADEVPESAVVLFDPHGHAVASSVTQGRDYQADAADCHLVASEMVHTRGATPLGRLDICSIASGKTLLIPRNALHTAARLASIALEFDHAAKNAEELKIAEQGRRSMTTYARCLLWHGDVTGRPGWETSGMEVGKRLFEWEIKIQDEFAAQQILPLNVIPGETYAIAWFRSRSLLDEDRINHNAAVALMSGTPSFSQEFRCTDRLGNLHWQREDVTIQPVSYGRWRAFSVVTDVTDRKRAEEDLQKAKETAEAANLAKDRFLAVLSHELRTPLTPVLATVNLVESRSDLPEELRTDLATIRKNIEMEARLIDDLLDLTRVNRGKVELRNEVVDAHQSIRAALQTCSSEAEAKGVGITLSLQASHHRIWADAARLQQVFWNLLKNAIKFTPSGGSIAVKSVDTGETKKRIQIEVIDTGIGIDPEVLPRLFDEFEQGESVITQRYGGLGLGLSISRSLVQLQGGLLTASSRGRDLGSTFTVEFPVTDERVAASTKEIDNKAPQTAHSIILLVDDHRDTLAVMSRLLRHAGYVVLTADSVAAAIKTADEKKFDLLVSDIGLPDGSGLDIMRHIRNYSKAKGIALSGFGMDEDLRLSLEAGFEKHLTKPINFKVLSQAIRDVLG